MLADAKRVADEEREAWRDDKKTLEDTIVDLTSSEKHIAEDRSSRDSEIREQEERAKVRNLFSHFCPSLRDILTMLLYRLLRSGTAARSSPMRNPYRPSSNSGRN